MNGEEFFRVRIIDRVPVLRAARAAGWTEEGEASITDALGCDFEDLAAETAGFYRTLRSARAAAQVLRKRDLHNRATILRHWYDDENGGWLSEVVQVIDPCD